MKRFLITVFITLFVLTSHSWAYLTKPQQDTDLYQVFNHFFFDPADSNALSSDVELMNSTGFLPNGRDVLWAQSGDVLRVDVTYRDADFGQELGYDYQGTHTTLIDTHLMPNQSYVHQDLVVQMPGSVIWSDTVYVMGDPMQRWYSDQQMNSLGAKDHMLAFAITDNAMLDVFNALYGTAYDAGVDQVWMLAFEEMNLGDADYTDLVAVVSQPLELNAVPLPASLLLLSSGLAGLAAIRRRMGKVGPMI